MNTKIRDMRFRAMTVFPMLVIGLFGARAVAHVCESNLVTLQVNETESWKIVPGHPSELDTLYTLYDLPDLLKADVSPWDPFVAFEGVYYVTGFAPGTTDFTVKWESLVGPYPGTTDYCHVEVRVGVPEWGENASLEADPSSTGLFLRWPTPSEGTVLRYEISVDGVLVDTVPEDEFHSYRIGALLPGKTYHVSVVACNDNGCSEELSADVTTETLSEAVLGLHNFITSEGWETRDLPKERLLALLEPAERVLDDGNPFNDLAAIQPLQRLLDLGDAEDWLAWPHVRREVESLIAGIKATQSTSDPNQAAGTDEAGCGLKFSASESWATTGGAPGFTEMLYDHWNLGQYIGLLGKETTIPLLALGDYIDVDGPVSDLHGDDFNNGVVYCFGIYVNVTPHTLYVNAESDGDDSWVVYVNGEEAGIWNGQQAVLGPHEFRVSAPAILNPGWNRVTIKLFEGGGGSGFRFRFTDFHTGEPLLDGDGRITVLEPPAFVEGPFDWAPI